MSSPTLTGIRVRSTRDARFIFHAVAQRKLPLVTKRLSSEERSKSIKTGAVFVWEERGATSDSPRAGIERWTDGKHWGPSRVRDEFLFYYEQERESHGRSQESPHRGPQERLVKQTFSVWVDVGQGTRKWHLVAYYTQESVDRLGTIDGILDAPALPDPEREYRSARTTRGRPRGEDLLHEQAERLRTCRDGASGVHLYPPPFECEFSRDHAHDHRLSPIHELPSITRTEPGRRLELAPLNYLQDASAPPRPPVDDYAIRALDSTMGRRCGGVREGQYGQCII